MAVRLASCAGVKAGPVARLHNARGVRSEESEEDSGGRRSANISTQKQHNTAISVHTRRPNRSDVTRSKSAINLPLLKLQIDVLNDIKI